MKYREEMPKELSRIRRILHTIAISSSECERGFSQMNVIVTPGRSSLLVKTTAYLSFIIIVEPPLTLFDPTNYVKTWLLQGHHSALDTKARSEKELRKFVTCLKFGNYFKVYVGTR
jgi:hypothetical protein